MKPKKSIGPKSSQTRRQNANHQHLRGLESDSRRQEKRLAAPSSGSTKSSSKLQSPPAEVANRAHTCSGCNKLIKREKYLLSACDKFWHESCLKCDRCHAKLAELGSSLYMKSDLILCRRDFLDLFGPSCVCTACEKLIRASEMVMRAKDNVYHLECFACQLCNQRFCVGDQFYLLENKVICQYDYEDIQRSMTGQLAALPCEPDFAPSSIIQPSSASNHHHQHHFQENDNNNDNDDVGLLHLEQQQRDEDHDDEEPALNLEELTAPAGAGNKHRVIIGQQDDDVDREEVEPEGGNAETDELAALSTEGKLVHLTAAAAAAAVRAKAMRRAIIAMDGRLE